jgi:histone acetyltransferase SAS3
MFPLGQEDNVMVICVCEAYTNSIVRFCGENEENDPAEEYEEYLACRTCGKNAHRQCARDEDAFKNENNGKNWFCQDCAVEGDEEEEDEDEDESLDSEPVNPTLRRRSSALKAASNSLQDDSADASRSLRKRKYSDAEHPQRPLRARRRGSDPDSTSAGADRSPSVFSDQDLDLDLESDSARPSRLRRTKTQERDLVSIVSSEGISLIVSFCLDAERMQKILTSRARKNRYKEKSKKKIQVELMVEEEPPHYPAIPTSHGSLFMPFLEREIEENKTKPYGGILTEVEADTSNTFPLTTARQKFEDARVRAEEDWKKKMTATNNAPEPTKPSQKMSGPPSKIKCINFGGFEIDTLNAAPYPEEYSRNKILYICEFCLKYMNSDFVAWRHKVRHRDSRYCDIFADKSKSSNVQQCILPEMKYIAMANILSSKSMAGRIQSTAKTSAF